MLRAVAQGPRRRAAGGTGGWRPAPGPAGRAADRAATRPHRARPAAGLYPAPRRPAAAAGPRPRRAARPVPTVAGVRARPSWTAGPYRAARPAAARQRLGTA